MSITDELRKFAESCAGGMGGDYLLEMERRIKALEHLTEGMLLDESELRGRVEAIERKLNHRGER